MAFYVYDANGYVGDLATVSGLAAFESYVDETANDDLVLQSLFEEGWSPADDDLKEALEALPRSGDADVNEVLDSFISLVKKCDEVLIISMGEEAGEEETKDIGLGAIFKYSDDQPRDPKTGQWIEAGRSADSGDSLRPGEQAAFSFDGGKPRSAFAEGNIESAKRLGSRTLTAPMVVQISGDGKGIFKSESKELSSSRQKSYANMVRDFIDLKACTQVRREIMASDINKMLKFDIVPEVVMKTSPKYGSGSCMAWIDGLSDTARAIRYHRDALYDPNTTEKERLTMRDNVFKASIFDFVLGGCDRHAGNIGYEASSKKLWLIDNGAMFGDTHQSWNKDFDRNGWGSGRAYWNALADYGVNKNDSKFSSRQLDKDYQKMGRQTKTALYKNEEAINKLFEAHKLPVKERNDFWNRVDQLSNKKIPGYVHL